MATAATFVDADEDYYYPGGVWGGGPAVTATLTGLEVGDVVFAVREYASFVSYNGYVEDMEADEGFTAMGGPGSSQADISVTSAMEVWYRVVELADAGTITATQTTSAVGGGSWLLSSLTLIAFRGLNGGVGYVYAEVANGIASPAQTGLAEGSNWVGMLWYAAGDDNSDITTGASELTTVWGSTLGGGARPTIFQWGELDGSGTLPSYTADGLNADTSTRSIAIVFFAELEETPQEAGPAFEFVSLRVNFRQLPHEVTSRMLDDFKKER